MKKVVTVDLRESFKIDDELEIKAYYAGHVLGAAMFYIKATTCLASFETCVYTGDYNMTPDRHLGAAWIDECKPDLLITESTYATTTRKSRRTREADFLKNVHEAVINVIIIYKGGKVLIPVFALGRAQELLLLIDSYWERMVDLQKIPIYFSAGLTEKSNDYYKLYVQWTNQSIKDKFIHENPFNFPRISSWR